MLKRQLTLLPVAILMFQGLRFIAPIGGAGQGAEVLDKKVGKIQTEQFSAYAILHKISGEAHVVIGVETGESSSNQSIAFEFPGGTVRQLLDSFVSQEPEYQWSEDNGVIHVLWHGARLPFADVTMFYPGAEDKMLKDIRSDIRAIPEIKAFLDSNHCSDPNTLFVSRLYLPPGDKRPFRRLSVDGGSMTLAELLDQVAVKSGENYWAIVQTPPGQRCEVDINLW